MAKEPKNRDVGPIHDPSLGSIAGQQVNEPLAGTGPSEQLPTTDAGTGEPVPPALSLAQIEALDGDRDGKAGGSLEQLTTYLTARHSTEFGPQGHFVDAKPADMAKHTEGTDPLLVIPTPEQLSLRRL